MANKSVNYVALHTQVFVKDIGQLPEKLDTGDSVTFSRSREFTMSLKDDKFIILRLKNKKNQFVEIQVPMTNVSHFVLDSIEV